jgi:hypothetical protein
MLTPSADFDFARRFDPETRPSAAGVVVSFESDAALERALGLARSQPWVAACRVELATRTLHLELCSGASEPPAPVRLH